ncbi:hypothetical protein JST97_30000 [bacterium]|nr:hypothetical protein [bacterium]
MITQALKSGRVAPSKKAPRLNSEAAAAVASAKASLASQKGYPWSQTEYNCALASVMDHLASQHGDAAAQELMRQMESVPVRGGRFNPWSGD